MDSNVFFYSERGLVNCIVLDLLNDIERTKKFLDLIKFGIDECRPTWLNEICGVDWYVEFSASEFGRPDLIADIKCTNDTHRVIFFEAKLSSYSAAAVPMEYDEHKEFKASTEDGKANNGIYQNKTSAINAQLALRYRLANVLRLTPAIELLGDEPQIQEQQDVALSYHDMFAAIHKSGTGRRIHNRKTIELFARIMRSRPQIYYVAMSFENPDYGFKRITEEHPKILPPIGIERWKSGEHKYFGILNLNLLPQVGFESNSYIIKCQDYVNYPTADSIQSFEEESAEDDDIPVDDNDIPVETDPDARFQWENLNRYDDNINRVYTEWYDIIESIAGDALVERKNSHSILNAENKTIMKLMIIQSKVSLGFKDCLPTNLIGMHSFRKKITPTEFEFINLSDIEDTAIDNIKMAITEVINREG